jgi:glycosyltransferase involved in cell wall biosynthesis
MTSKNINHREKKVTIVIPHFERTKLLELNLRTIDSLYADQNVEVIIVDDCSRESMRPVIPLEFKLTLRLVQIQDKNGINPCTPFNMGVDHAEGEIIVLTSPEVIHTQSIFEMTPSILEIEYDQYFVVPVFAITDEKINHDLLETKEHRQIQKIVLSKLKEFEANLGINGYSYANDLGAWYSHPVFKDSKLNFLSIISKNSYFNVGGFDPRFRNGTGFDDLDFLRKLQATGFEIIYPESLPAIHLDHEEVSSTSKYKKEINSNNRIYNSTITRALKFGRRVEKHTCLDWDMEKSEFMEIACSCHI